ncbi:MAG: VOC family protein [Acidimicrobiia bacterium]|jgi:catechol 2,3-dioxygenase-like lactoylglutathione lyase family enzyme
MDFQMVASLPASDIDRARSWYQEKLGVQPSMTQDDTALMYTHGDSAFMVYASQFAGTNQATAAGLVVADFDAALVSLRSSGVTFEDYDFGDGMATVEGVMTDPSGRRMAWFKDSEGNILGLAEDPTP